VTTWEQVKGGRLELHARAIQAQLAPLFGTRATGRALVKRATGGGEVELPPNEYAVPLITTTLESVRPNNLVKVAFNPLTERPHKQGGAWTIPDDDDGIEVTFVAQVGGTTWAAITAGQRLRWDPPVPGLEPEMVVTQSFTGGARAADQAAMTVIDLEIDDARSLLDAKLGAFPAIVVGWIGSEPVEGRTAGMRQGSTRKRRDVRAYHEAFSLYIVSTSAEGHGRRRRLQELVEACRNVLSDRSMNDDGELLSSVGTGLEILTASARAAQSPNVTVGLVQLRAVTTLQRVDARTWNRWETLTVGASLPASTDPDAPEEQQEPLPMVQNVIAEMPQDED